MGEATERKYNFAIQEGGGITVLNLFFLSVVALFAGIAIDVSSVISARTQADLDAAAADGLCKYFGLCFELKTTAVLDVIGINYESRRVQGAPVSCHDRDVNFQIGRGNKFPLTKIFYRFFFGSRRRAQQDTVAIGIIGLI